MGELLPGRPMTPPDRPQALQDTFLDHLRKHEVPVTMFLTNGVRLQGYVGRFDSYSVLLVRDRQAQLVYKHAISTILPGEPVRVEQSGQQEASQELRQHIE
jgi:host factor-I protein